MKRNNSIRKPGACSATPTTETARNLPDDWTGALVDAGLRSLAFSDVNPEADPLLAHWQRDNIAAELALTACQEEGRFNSWLVLYRWDGRNWLVVYDSSEANSTPDDPLDQLIEALELAIDERYVEDELLAFVVPMRAAAQHLRAVRAAALGSNHGL